MSVCERVHSERGSVISHALLYLLWDNSYLLLFIYLMLTCNTNWTVPSKTSWCVSESNASSVNVRACVCACRDKEEPCHGDGCDSSSTLFLYLLILKTGGKQHSFPGQVGGDTYFTHTHTQGLWGCNLNPVNSGVDTLQKYKTWSCFFSLWRII